MKRIFLLAALILIFAETASAQTMSPLVSECGHHCTGQFTVTNNGLQAMAIVVEALSFKIDPATGRSVFRPLDSGVQFRLSETSARVGAKSPHIFFYDLTCNSAPCPVAFVASMITGHTTEGLAIRTNLWTSVYACEKAKGCRDSVRKASGL
jgi:hypothetical protein